MLVVLDEEATFRADVERARLAGRRVPGPNMLF